jgi:hypothetical protein
MRAGALTYAAISALRADHPDRAAALASSALTTVLSPAIRGAVSAALARSLLQLGRIDQAAAAISGVEPAATLISEFDELVRLARAEVAARTRAPDAAFVTREARDTILRRAATLADPMRRNAYLARPHLVAATLTLAESPTH